MCLFLRKKRRKNIENTKLIGPGVKHCILKTIIIIIDILWMTNEVLNVNYFVDPKIKDVSNKNNTVTHALV